MVLDQNILYFDKIKKNFLYHLFLLQLDWEGEGLNL